MAPTTSAEDNNGIAQTKKQAGTKRFRQRLQKRVENIASVQHEVVDLLSGIDCRGSMRRMCSLDTLKSKLPIINWLPNYRLHHLQGDVIAGVTVGLMVIPQGLAYAKIAELPPQYGLYSAIGVCFVYALFGTSREMASGPGAIMALLAAQYGQTALTGDVRPVMLLTFISGVVQLAISVLNGGFVLDYISHPVVNSFTTAAAITIMGTQIKKWLGLRKVPKAFIPQLINVCQRLGESKVYDFSLGLVCMIVLYILKKLRASECVTSKGTTQCAKFIKYIVWLVCTARNVVVVTLSSVAAFVISTNTNTTMPFYLTGNIQAGVPPFRVPEFSWTADNVTHTFTDNIRQLGAGIFVVPAISVIESVAIAKAYGRKKNYHPDSNQEIMALGISNIFGSFLSSFTISGTMSRSAVNEQSGVQTPAGNIFTGAMVLLALRFLTPLFYYIPDSALAAVIIMAISDMIDFSLVPEMWKVNKMDLIPWFLTFIFSLLVSVEVGIVVGALVSLIPLLHPWSRPKAEKQEFEIRNSKVLVFTPQIGLLFPGVQHLEEEICKAAREGESLQPRTVILNLEHVTSVDYTVVHGVHQIQHTLMNYNIHLGLCNIRPQLKSSFNDLKHVSFGDTLDDALALINASTDDEDKQQQKTDAVNEYNTSKCVIDVSSDVITE